MRGIACNIFVVLLSLSFFTFVFNVQTAKANPATIYIRANGSIDPLTAPISTPDSINYEFIGNINDSIVIERDNIVLDGAGYTLQGTGTGTGISLSNRNHITIKNMNVGEFATGIYLYQSSSNTITNSTVTDSSSQAIRVHSAGSSGNLNVIENNTLSGGGSGVYFSSDGNYAGDLAYNDVSHNIIKNYDNGIFLNPSYQLQSQMEYNTFGRNDVSSCTTAIRIAPSAGYCAVRYNVFSNNVLRDGQYGFYIDEWNGRGVEVYRNNFTDNKLANFSSYGAFFANSETYYNDFGNSNTLNGNHFYHYAYRQNETVIGLNLSSGNDATNLGLFTLVSSQNIALENCTLSGDRETGVFLWSSNNNTIINSNITLNAIGIRISGSNYNVIYHNDFVHNTNQVQVTAGSTNTWDNGYPSGGNYWSDYAGIDIKSGPYQNQTGSDGIGDTHYIIDADNTDHYPLMNQIIIIPEFQPLLLLLLFVLMTLLGTVIVKERNVKGQQSVLQKHI